MHIVYLMLQFLFHYAYDEFDYCVFLVELGTLKILCPVHPVANRIRQMKRTAQAARQNLRPVALLYTDTQICAQIAQNAKF